MQDKRALSRTKQIQGKDSQDTLNSIIQLFLKFQKIKNKAA